ncbi:hypothetical protein LshimejAT787_0101240 [Lyophyllum shimeji]|uniref:Uncharacterized protein n=1 Tax=Lyophyllum shimeji TaxID=47721 RepID=A0A9P3PCB2_LYOSH|nr:hypothetical protein LshimejAT787_0101240 [Lyophyllum shimeji]
MTASPRPSHHDNAVPAQETEEKQRHTQPLRSRGPKKEFNQDVHIGLQNGRLTRMGASLSLILSQRLATYSSPLFFSSLPPSLPHALHVRRRSQHLSQAAIQTDRPHPWPPFPSTSPLALARTKQIALLLEALSTRFVPAEPLQATATAKRICELVDHAYDLGEGGGGGGVSRDVVECAVLLYSLRDAALDLQGARESVFRVVAESATEEKPCTRMAERIRRVLEMEQVLIEMRRSTRTPRF